MTKNVAIRVGVAVAACLAISHYGGSALAGPKAKKAKPAAKSTPTPKTGAGKKQTQADRDRAKREAFYERVTRALGEDMFCGCTANKSNPPYLVGTLSITENGKTGAEVNCSTRGYKNGAHSVSRCDEFFVLGPGPRRGWGK